MLQDDPREIFRAAADAEKICDFIMDLELTQEQRLERQTERESFADATPFMDDKVQDAVSRKEGTVSREVSSPEKVRERIYLNVPYREKTWNAAGTGEHTEIDCKNVREWRHGVYCEAD